MLLDKGYIALALLSAKDFFFNEPFATKSELNQFTVYCQAEFIKRELGIGITSNLDREAFNTSGYLITINNCNLKLEHLDDNILDVLVNPDFLGQFFRMLESRRLERLEDGLKKDSQKNIRKRILNG